MSHAIMPFADQTLNPPFDGNDPDAASTAVELQIPETFSNRAKRVIRYFDATAFLYQYKGRFVLTDESLYLTSFGDGSPAAPIGFPRWTGDSLEELESWLEDLADEFDQDGEIYGWEDTKS